MKRGEMKQCITVVLIMICMAFTGTFMLKYKSNLCETEEKIQEQNPHEVSFLASGETVESIAEDYNLDYEIHNYKILRTTGLAARVMPDNRTMDVPSYTEGTAPQSKNEIAVDRNYYEQHHLKLGDKIVLGEEKEEYQITGAFVLSDQLEPMVDNQGSSYDAKSQGFFLMTEEEYCTLDEMELSIYVAKLRDNLEMNEDWKKKMQSDTRIMNLVLATEDAQMNVLAGKITLFTATVISCAAILGLTVFVTLAMAISRKVAKEEAGMGVLKALGYQTYQIVGHYCEFGLYVLVGAILGYVAGSLFAPIFTQQLNDGLLIPVIPVRFWGAEFLYFVVAPTILFTIASVLLAAFYLRRQPLQMIYENSEDKVNWLVRRKNRSTRDRSFLQSVRRTVTANHLVLVFFMGFAGLAIAAQLQMAYSLQRMCSNMVTSVFEGCDYVSNVHFLNEQEDLEESDIQTPYQEVSCSIGSGNNSTTCQIQILPEKYENIKLLSYHGEKQIDVNEEDGIVINYWMQNKFGVKTGDHVELTIGNHKVSATIAQIQQAYTGNVIYCSEKTAREYGIIAQDDPLSYNGMYTKEMVEFQEGQHTYVTYLADMKATMMSKAGMYNGLSLIFIVLGFVLSIITMTLVMRSVISSNKKYLAMMKTFGYNERESAKAVLSGYRIIALVGFGIGTVYGYVLMKLIFGMVSKQSSAYYPMTTDAIGILISFAAFVLIYEIVYRSYRRQIGEIPLKEVM